MTEIQLITNDQLLVGVVTPKVASGDINSVILHVDFDSTWDRFTARSATFYTSKDSTVYESLLINNECTIQPEVLTKPGILYIGVRGLTSDGESLKTSAVVKYKIAQGAKTGERTLFPSLDMYQQYLAALREQADPVLQAIKAEAASMLEPNTLWENLDTTEEFAAQEIKFDTTQYKRFDVIFRENTEEDSHTCVAMLKGYTGTATALNNRIIFGSDVATLSEGKTAARRSFIVNDNGLTVSDCKVEKYRRTQSNSSDLYHNNYATENTYLIPAKVIGYKY